MGVLVQVTATHWGGARGGLRSVAPPFWNRKEDEKVLTVWVRPRWQDFGGTPHNTFLVQQDDLLEWLSGWGKRDLEERP
jgi:hypothetical protein